jgi:hypothetical protein
VTQEQITHSTPERATEETTAAPEVKTKFDKEKFDADLDAIVAKVANSASTN